MQELEYQTWKGARDRYRDGIPAKVETYLNRELALIAKLEFAPYFLTVFDIVRFARGRGILCQGRGSAANSAVCYSLGITAVDPDRYDELLDAYPKAQIRNFDGRAEITELDALIAYLQVLGTMVDFSTYQVESSR